MKSGYYRLEHTYYSRGGNKYHGPSSSLHLSAVQNYHANANKAKHVVSINMPDDRYELYAALMSHSNTVKRKNSHLAEGLIVSFDNRMIEAHREEAIKGFAHRVTFGGKIKAYVYEHLNDPGNRHAHVLVIDRSADGSEIGYFGRNATFRREHSPVKGNPTEWFRTTWETECNLVLEKHGYDFRIDRRSNLDRGLEKAGEHRGWEETASLNVELEQSTGETSSVETPETANPIDNTAPESTLEPVELAPEETTIAPEEDDEMVIGREGPQSPHQRVKDALEYDSELHYLRHVKGQVAHHEAGLIAAEAEADRLAEVARAHQQNAFDAEKEAWRTGEALGPYTKANGKLRGIHINVGFRDWRLEWKSEKRETGERLQTDKSRHEYRQRMEQKAAEDVKYSAEVWAKQAADNKLQLEAHQRELNAAVRAYGDKATLETAEKILSNSVENELSQLTASQVMDEFEAERISAEEAIRAFELMGEIALADDLRNRIAIEQDVDPEHVDDGIEP